jgi:hypothetical protein
MKLGMVLVLFVILVSVTNNIQDNLGYRNFSGYYL